jgi:peptidoglycan/xylan/chitin deacetylase (PgdA/CDA1 family)
MRAERHIITLSFDDGFEKSSIKTAEIYEKYGLSACINVVATGHTNNPRLPNEFRQWKCGDFTLWNDLKRRGHEIMPHSYEHTGLDRVTFEEGKSLILKCLDVFSKELAGFEAKKAIYNFAYNASTPEIEEWLSAEVRAFRGSGPHPNPLPYDGMKKLTCISYGANPIDKYLEESINNFLAGPPAWYIFNTHGVDGEGWGPISAGYLDELLDRLTQLENVLVLPAADALDLA